MGVDSLKPIAGIPFPQYYEFFMDWKTVVGFATLYAASVHYFNPSVKDAQLSRVEAKNRGETEKVTKSGKAMTAFVFAHNLLLAIYSGVTFVNMAYNLHKLFNRGKSFHDAACDLDGFFWEEGLGYWGYLFYLSKFYEVVDTIIIILKGRRSSLLQTYHHSGAMITMWSGIRFKSQPISIFVVFNSLVHTIMYSYYAMTSIGLHPPGKKYLTSVQISQFLVGMSLGFTYLFAPNCLQTPGQVFSLSINLLYLFPLTYLFLDFARKTYGKRKSVKKTQ